MGRLVLNQPRRFDGAGVVVELRDTGLADAPADIVAQLHARVSGDYISAIPFEFFAEVRPDTTYTVAAEIRRGARLAPGDLRNVASHLWRAGDANPVTIEVTEVA